MRVEKLSASAITAYEACPAFFKAVYLDRVDRKKGEPAALGNALHEALEEFVRAVYLERRIPLELAQLKSIFEVYFDAWFGHGAEQALFEDGIKLLERWFYRTDLSPWEVISVEDRQEFQVETPLGTVALKYIIDRLDRRVDQDGIVHYRVVDYKSQRIGFKPTAIRRMIQFRVYALAAAIAFKDESPIIEVQADLLRHGPVSAVFSREDNLKTWSRLRELVYSIQAHDGDNPDRTVGAQCRYCPISAQCPTLLSNIDLGGSAIYATDIPLAVQAVHDLDNRIAGLTDLRETVGEYVLKYAEDADLTEWTDGGFRVTIKAGKRRSVDSERLANVIGPDLMNKYGKVGVTALDEMEKNGELTSEQLVLAKELINTNLGEIKVKVDRRTPFEGDEM